ncbi:MAG: extracellular solute-binding protein, partial [Actinomycetes bacterium]
MRCPRRPRLQPGSHRAKKLAAILMVGAATAACGSSGGSGSTTTTAAAKTSTTAAASSTTASSSSSSSSSTTAKSSTGGSRVNLTFWEAMGGALGQTLQHLVSQFNASQSTYKVTAVYKGSYSTTMSDTIAAFRAHKAPDIAQIFDAGTTTFMASKGAYEPVWQIMKKNNIPFSTSDFIGGAASYYETAANKLYSLPFNSSTPVLYYNKALLKKAGISGPPKTWEDLAADAPKLVQAGAKCVYSPSGAYIMWT